MLGISPPFRTHVPRKSPSGTSARHTYTNTNQLVVSVIIVFGGGEGVSGGDICQITGGVFAYVCTGIR